MPTNVEFPKATYRYDPYRNYKFRVKMGDQYVAGISKVSALTRSTQMITHRAGGDSSSPRRMPGQNDYAAITLERGITHDVAFEQWANKVWDYHNTGVGDQATSLGDFRRDLVIEVYNQAGQKVMAYNVYRCWVSEFVALPEFDVSGNAVAIEHLKIEHEGWERDTSVTEPTEPNFTLTAS